MRRTDLPAGLADSTGIGLALGRRAGRAANASPSGEFLVDFCSAIRAGGGHHSTCLQLKGHAPCRVQDGGHSALSYVPHCPRRVLMPHPTFRTREQAQAVDRLAVERLGLSSCVLMENAGRGLADLLARLGARGPVAILCGPGNNGGDGLVLARHLTLREVPVRVALCAEPARLGGDAGLNWHVWRQANAALEIFADPLDAARLAAWLNGAEWIVDALLGTGARGEPRGVIAGAIAAANASPARRLAVDLPSGLDCDTGRPAAQTIRADETATFFAPKAAFAQAEARRYTGRIHVLDIGLPSAWLAERTT